MKRLASLLRTGGESATLMTWLSIAVTMGSSVLVLPVALHKLSETELALWLSFSLLLNFAMLADFGFSSSAVRAAMHFSAGAARLPGYGQDQELARSPAGPNLTGLLRLESTLRWIYQRLAFLSVTLCMGGALWVMPARFDALPSLDSAWLSLVFLLSSVTFTLIGAPWGVMRQMLGRVAAVRRTETLVGLGRIGCLLAVLLSGAGVAGIMATQTVAAVVSWQLHRRAYRSERVQSGIIKPLLEKQCDRDLFPALWPSTWRQGVIVMGGYFINQSGGLIIAQLPDNGQAVRYLLTLRLFAVARQFAQAPVYAHLPLFNRLYAEGAIAKLKSEFARRIFLSLLLLTLCLGGVYTVMNVLAPWLGYREFLVSFGVYVLMAASLILEAHHGAHANLYVVRNHVPFLFPSLLSGGSIMLLGYWAAERHGVLGVVCVQMAVQLCCNNWYPVYLNLKKFNWPLPAYLGDLGRSLIATLSLLRQHAKSVRQ